MSFSFRPAVKSQAKPLVGLYAESGCGKTLSALYLARGFAGNRRIGMIETEAGRGEAYAGVIDGSYDVLSLRETFSPRDYGEAITAAEKAELAALIIDSGSHEWEATGGVLHMAAANQEGGKKGPLIWQQPKLDHRRHFIQRLISTPIPLVILCMRARYPMREDKGKKEWVRSEVLVPMQSDDILFEMFVHGWIDREHKFRGTKYTLGELREVIRDGEMISLETGQRLAAWARGETSQQAAPTVPAQSAGGTTAVSPRRESVGTTDAPSSERAALIEEVNALKLGMPNREWLDMCATYFDGERSGSAMAHANIEKLNALVSDLRAKKTVA